jgi:CheY-like chemotaxis protein
VVDDIGSNREVMVGFLQGVGFETVEARDGREGIRLAGEIRPDLILMDLYMPVINGFEAALRIRQIPELRGVVIIAVSASVSEANQSQSQQAGYDAFLSKPVSWPKLSGLLEKHLKLDWDYSEVKDQTVATTEPRAGKTEALAPPKEELTKLLELARMGDLSAMQERATQLKTADEGYIPFADRLCELAQGFEEQEILHWMEECLEVK